MGRGVVGNFLVSVRVGMEIGAGVGLNKFISLFAHYNR